MSNFCDKCERVDDLCADDICRAMPLGEGT